MLLRFALFAVVLLCVAQNSYASLEEDCVWAGGVWAPTVWADDVWDETCGGPTIPTTNVIGEANSAAADMALEADGLDLGAVTERCSAEADDEVVGQDPAPGVLVDLGTLVDVLVSNGVACVNSGGTGVRVKGLRMRGL